MSTSFESRLRRLDQRVTPLALLSTGGLLIIGLWMLGRWVAARATVAAEQRAALSVMREDLELDLAERQALRNLLSRDLSRAKVSAATLTRSRRVLFEGGLAVSQEKRLLEKQYEIMSRWIQLDASADKIHLMRGDQISESQPLTGARPRVVGGVKAVLPAMSTIISKERFANTERPRSDQVGGQLQWEPPQVGTSLRANALGEFVLFTKEGLVIHGPPLKKTEHEVFPHLCLSLPVAVARRLYGQSFVGTKIRMLDKM